MGAVAGLGLVIGVIGCNNSTPNPCGSSSLSGALAFPVLDGLAFSDPDAGIWVVWLWDQYDAGAGNSGPPGQDWQSYCGSVASSGFTSAKRPAERLLYLSIAPPLAGAHSQPPDAGATALLGIRYEQGDELGVDSSAGSFVASQSAAATGSTMCVTGPLQLTFSDDGGAAGTMTGQINVPICTQ
jgi:hypothetical protein